MSNLILVVFSLSLISACVGQLQQTGQCADLSIPVVTDFNPVTYAGTWYDIESIETPRQSGTCNLHTWTNVGDTVNVRNSQVVSTVLQSVTGTGTRTTGQPVGTARYTLTITSSTGVATTSDYWVLGTDYATYALVYSCRNVGGTTREINVWKLGRNTGPLPDLATQNINDIITSIPALNTAVFQQRSHSAEDCNASVELPGACPTVAGIAGFDVNRFLGAWSEVARFPNDAQSGRCNRAVYTAGATADVFTVENSEVNSETLSTISGSATVPGTNGLLQVTFNIGGVPRISDLYVLATDYDDYALVYSCVAIEPNRRRVSSWKLRKTTNPLTAAQNDDISAAIAAVDGPDEVFFQETYQNDEACFYYPDFDVLPETIEFRGSCPTTITGAANFNLNTFVGTWHEHQRYPNQAQTGQCNRAVYATGATADVVSVENSEVNAEALNTILGSARPTGQTGVLEVDLNVGGVTRTSTLHVLATDNLNYALLYSCVTIDENRRRVSSWKLSKSTNPLTPAQNAAIDAVISTTQGLRNGYYLDISQSDAACFYYPNFDVLPETIEFRGSCPTTIPGAANFNLNTFVGTWHEHQRYPNQAQTGQCNRAVYATGATADVVSVENSEVNAEALNTILGSARPTGQTGVLEVDLNVGGVTRTSTLHVLATDNLNYALLYSCVTIDENRRRVSSWKLSKSTNPLTPAQNAAIDAVISTTQGLRNGYYLDISQSDAACFYYPNFDVLPETIEFRGSCPTTIPGAANFNLNTFVGTWHEHQRYPNQAQTGQCNRAVYATGATADVVSVENSEVNAEALNTILGSARPTGQTGVLEVDLNVGGVTRTSTLHVLATDNLNYALLYSCVTIDENRRRVSSWKLSKSTNPLTPAQNAAIDAVISTTQGLRNDYYLDISQSDAACFYYPNFDVLPETIEFRGSCPTTIPGAANFNLNTFVGTWHEHQRYPNQAQTGQCNRAVYATGATADVVSVENSEVNAEALNTILGSARPTGQTGVLEVDLNVGGVTRTSTLHVLATDNLNYALLYSCVTIDGNRRRVSSWKLSKSTTPLTPAQNAAIDAVISTTQGLRNDYYLDISQSDAACFYYPDFDVLPETIEFRGSCPTIPGAANFNLNTFLGTWYEVARYPNQAQTGQCNRAVYAAGATADVISVENSEVSAEALNTILGSARPTGQTGVLEVNLNVGGVTRTSTLHVLATDNLNYALLYSCVPIDGNRRRVSSWKLSKSTNSLTAAQNAAIDAVISTTQGLRNDYYLDISQSDAACFYYPDFDVLPGTIELPGSCPITITGAANFNLNNFLGTWYEVARYPNQAQTGQCNRAVYAAGATADVISVENSEVSAEALNTILGSARPTGQTGVLEVNLNVGGVTRTSTLHVLATDNINYALLYSCVTIDGNRRRVSSWKLSKSTNPLTPAQNAAIDAVISTTQGLRNDYYLDISQSDAACFYYPDFDVLPGTIEFRGTCPTTIAGAANFNLNTFVGIWHEHQRYPNQAQTGQCNRAVYATGATADVVSVENSEVNAEALNTILGSARPTGQTGVLEVDLNVGGVTRTSTLHVLATDNLNYALLYSCVTIDGNRRRVSSWKLSKSTNPLTPAQNAAIDAVISTTQGLRNDYYLDISQSDAACFYYPDFDVLPGTIEFRGSCPTTITGAANFNLNTFVGTWYEHYRYPNQAQTGQCNRAVYAAGATADVLSVENSEVSAEALNTILGSARPTGQTGVLEVDLNVGGVIRTSTLYVLTTDNENYALVYSCVPIDENRRRVSSWKLSKSTNPLTAAQNAAIDAVISTTQGLRNDYYLEISQSDAACFYYPDFDVLPATIEFRGPCPTVPGVPSFNLNTFLGTWYEVARYPNQAQTGQCNRAVYATGATADVVSVENSEVIAEALNTILGSARLTGQSGVLEVDLTVGGVIRTSTLHVLATDYHNYALVYSCAPVEGNRRRVSSWKLSKSTNPLTPAQNAAIDAVIDTTQGLRNDYYQATNQNDAACFYYPEFSGVLPSSIEFRGSCPGSITGSITNFDLGRFTGTWREVARYPNQAQTGQCNRAVYETGATSGFVSVENSQVNNEALTTISGEARAVGQNGQLEVTLNVGGENRVSNLHVLATDYENYALVYSCAPIEGNQHRVTSWKLSKSANSLTPAQNAEIDAVIETTQGLRNDYYQATNQSDAACFYYPNFDTLPSSIEFRGPCPTVTPVSDFDLNEFLGSWHEVARYPQPTQTGQCNRAVYSQVEDSGISVVNSQVVDQTYHTISGEIRTTSQPGVLEVEFIVGGATRTSNLTVLATDYDNYALVYSCTNLEENRRRVGSWKLSRSTSALTDESNAAIEVVVNEIQGLSENYYVPTSQTDTACFYYPIQTGENVIIPGQCDTTITGVSNIDLTRFTDELVWYQIQRYDAVIGTCIGTRLTLDEGYVHLNHIERVGDEVKRATGVARLSSSETGRFTIEMEDSDEQEEIYIMATDYDGYAIAYNCKNVGINERQVGVWQLSRERTMPSAGNTAFNALVEARPEFTTRETYLKQILHPSPAGDECPEPSSAFLFKSSIIVIFVCTVLQLVR